MQYKLDDAYIKIILYNATNNISVEDISKNIAELLGYSTQELIGSNFIKILDYSVVSIIEDCIEFNDGIINIAETLNKIPDFYLKDFNNYAINCRIKACNFANNNQYDTIVYIRIMEVNLTNLWQSFYVQQEQFPNDETDKLVRICRFISRYNVNSYILVIECEKLGTSTNKTLLTQCIKNEFTQLNNDPSAIAYIGGDCLIAILCNTNDDDLPKIMGKIYHRFNCILVNHSINSKVTMQQNLMLTYGRYALSKVTDIQDIIRLTMENVRI
ncbi:hypothetical protein CAXC1_20005 [Candidatus Xenohaliotis californiensis]|uniref:PAS domain-containing protein n=1 Tax=Candidatus Xenohaliotis californiensis TaxID=84677 RepID=A0ABP0EW30_9RICK|nr:hypothetical protein CAXC1_20005 [Candidatus Xenohaliotis californiensis]